MELDMVCETCGSDLIGIPAKYGAKVRVEIMPCEHCLENAREEEREKLTKENE